MKSRNTRPEQILAELLVRSGHVDFSQHVRALPGTPDFVFDGARLAVFVHGCYWHRHFRCARARTPRKDTFVWTQRFAEQVLHDQAVVNALRRAGWRVFVAWECELLIKPHAVSSALVDELRRDAWPADADVTSASRSAVASTHSGRRIAGR